MQKQEENVREGETSGGEGEVAFGVARNFFSVLALTGNMLLLP